MDPRRVSGDGGEEDHQPLSPRGSETESGSQTPAWTCQPLWKRRIFAFSETGCWREGEGGWDPFTDEGAGARPQPMLYVLPRLFPKPRDPPPTGSSLHRHSTINHTALRNFLLLLKRDARSRQTPRVCEWWGPTWGFHDLLVMGDSPTRPSPAAGSSPSLRGALAPTKPRAPLWTPPPHPCGRQALPAPSGKFMHLTRREGV